MQVVIIADDFTGALDVAVQFAAYDVIIKIAMGQSIHEAARCCSDADILVIDAETRHLSQEDAAKATGELVKLYQTTEAKTLYLKLDSALRGNVGAALTTALAVSGCSFLALAPAFPDMHRLTRGGVQYDGDTPIHLSPFGNDPFTPVRTSAIADLFAGHDVQLRLYPRAKTYDVLGETPAIGIFDVEDNEDFVRIAQQLRRSNRFELLAGCAAFASVLPSFLDMRKHNKSHALPGKPLLVLCGSLNPITRRQLKAAADNGFALTTLPAQNNEDSGDARFGSMLKATLDGKTNVILQTEDINGGVLEASSDADKQSISQATADRMGNLLRSLYEQDSAWNYLPMIIGGDTLTGVMRQLSTPDITVEQELEPGVVLFSVMIAGQYTPMISKSGGFGDAELLLRIAQAAQKKG